MTEQIALIDSCKLRLHEQYEIRRVDEVFQSLQNEKILKNPIIVVKMEFGLNYLILDGVHRFLSLTRLGYTQIPCQILEQKDFILQSWSHVVEYGDWVESLSDKVEKYNGAPESESEKIRIWVGNNHDHREIWATKFPPSSIHELVTEWNEITSLYINRYPLTRVEHPFVSMAGENKIIVQYPSLQFDEIIQLVREGCVLPPGVTRFIVHHKFENVNIRLSELDRSQFLEESSLQLK
ncbi:ParB N-terminal domain-containing protein [Paenibacillus sp. FSL M7-0420]|uniref:ParB N-terminal domain-containing protein n=1 Tax=Paenibacillus sp. FSL M7-0420 TaxID=2921609 RepID=UPI0030F964EF